MKKNQEQISPVKVNNELDITLCDMKKFLFVIIGMAILSITASCGQGDRSSVQNQDGIPATGQSFSSDMIVTLSSGQVMFKGEIFVTPQATRMDWKQGSSNLSSIRLEQENTEYLYNHDKKVYYEMDLNEDEEVSNFLKSVNDYEEIEELGREKVGGLNCKKKKVKSSFQVMGMNVTSEMLIWQADGIDIPIRSEGEEGTVTELKNISKKPPSPKHFQPLKGYKRVNNMMEVMEFGGMDFDMGELDYSEKRRGEGHAPDGKNLNRSGNVEVIDLDQIYENATSMLKPVFTDKDEYEEMKEMLAVAVDEAKEMDFSEGSAEMMWSVIPQRKGDIVESEFRVRNMYGAQLQTSSTMEDVCSFYEKELKSKGWKVEYNAVFDGEGVLRFQNSEYSFTISSGDIENNKRLKNYTLQLSPDF
ncbi:MAG TPA: DUF4412 domain-containing protein [Mariniphaga anaerophila]|uniref:DUF4412 domain-containing protein n=1 Tax=Mariniphaga anaerophila TaxID=1484053 RepID=A0A831LFT1_9BACT|nr:DUF4412 domain-containing protein [Mariniphaga anaerophila]